LATIEKLKYSQESGLGVAYANGFSEGQAACRRSEGLSAYQRVGIDEYARGFRAGYFSRPVAHAAVPERSVALQVVNL